MKHAKKRSFRPLIYCIGNIILIISLISGMAIAEKNIRKIAFGEDLQIVHFQKSKKNNQKISFCFLDRAFTVDFTAGYNYSKSLQEQILSRISHWRNITTDDE